MGHAKVGDTIKILDDNSGSWVKVGKEYYVETVYEECDPEKVYGLKGVNQSWCGEPCHFEITSSVVSKTHPRYDTFEVGNTVRRWRDVEQWEWEGIGAINPLPLLGEDLDVVVIDTDSVEKEDRFYVESYGWFPMKAFVLAEYYNHTITNQGTVDNLNTNSYGKDHTIKVQRPSASIVTGQRTSRGGVQGRRNAAVTRGGYSSHEAITGK